jgi:hypothetical protein
VSYTVSGARFASRDAQHGVPVLRRSAVDAVVGAQVALPVVDVLADEGGEDHDARARVQQEDDEEREGDTGRAETVELAREQRVLRGAPPAAPASRARAEAREHVQREQHGEGHERARQQLVVEVEPSVAGGGRLVDREELELEHAEPHERLAVQPGVHNLEDLAERAQHLHIAWHSVA